MALWRFGLKNWEIWASHLDERVGEAYLDFENLIIDTVQYRFQLWFCQYSSTRWHP